MCYKKSPGERVLEEFTIDQMLPGLNKSGVPTLLGGFLFPL